MNIQINQLGYIPAMQKVAVMHGRLADQMHIVDAAFAQRMLDAAQRAWAFLQQSEPILFRNPEEISTGGYGDGSDADERLWAHVEQTEAYTSLFQNKSKYNAMMAALAGLICREFNAAQGGV